MSYIAYKIKRAKEKLMIGVFIVIVKELKMLNTVLRIVCITLSIICIPPSKIRSFSFVFILLDPKSGGTRKGMSCPMIIISKIIYFSIAT